MSSNMIRTQINIIISTVIAYIISLIPLQIATSFYITLGFIPILVLGLKFGFKASLEASFLWGVLTLITGQAQILSFSQGFIEYIIAFTFGGLCGLYNLNKHPLSLKTIFISLFIGIFARYFWHFIAGFIFWKQYMPSNFNPYLYSLITNTTSAILSFIIDFIILALIYKIQPKLFYQTKY